MFIPWKARLATDMLAMSSQKGAVAITHRRVHTGSREEDASDEAGFCPSPSSTAGSMPSGCRPRSSGWRRMSIAEGMSTTSHVTMAIDHEAGAPVVHGQYPHGRGSHNHVAYVAAHARKGNSPGPACAQTTCSRPHWSPCGPSG